MRKTMVVACCMILATSICTAAAADIFRVSANQTPVYDAPSAASQQIATVQASDILSADNTSGWTLVTLPDGRKGWVRDTAGTRMSAGAATEQPTVQTPVAVVTNPNAVVLQQLVDKLRRVATDFAGRDYAGRNFRRDLLAGFKTVLTGAVLAEYTQAVNDPETDFDGYLGNLKNCSVDNVEVSRATSTQIDATGTLRVKVALARAVEDNGGGIAEGGIEQNYAVYLQFANMQGMTVERLRALVAQHGLENLVAEQVNRTTFVAKKEGQTWKISKMDLAFQETRLLTTTGMLADGEVTSATTTLASSLTNTPVATASNVPLASGTALGTPIVVGQTIAGMLSASDMQDTTGNYYDVYYFSGREGERVYIKAISEACNIRMLLKGPNGFQVIDNRDSRKTRGFDNQLLPATGAYTIVLTGMNRGTSTYRIRLDRPGTITLESNAVVSTVDYGHTVFGQLSNTDPFFADGAYYKAFRFEGRRGMRITVKLHSDMFNPWMAITGPNGFYYTNDRLENGDGITIGWGEYNWEDYAGAKELELPSDGTYTVIVSTNRPVIGSFGLRLDYKAVLPYSGAPVGQIIMGQPISGNLAAGDGQFEDRAYYDVYSFQAQAGEVYELRGTYTPRDKEMTILISEQNGFMQSYAYRGTQWYSRSGAHEEGKARFTAPVTGTYYFYVSSRHTYGLTEMTYQFTIKRLTR